MVSLLTWKVVGVAGMLKSSNSIAMKNARQSVIDLHIPEKELTSLRLFEASIYTAASSLLPFSPPDSKPWPQRTSFRFPQSP